MNKRKKNIYLDNDRSKKYIVIAVIGIVLMIVIAGLLIFNHSSQSDEQENENLVQENIDTTTLGDASIDPENTEINEEEGTSVKSDTLSEEKGKSNGIDVSKWQGKIDWKKVKKSHIDFAFIRIGYRGEDGKIYKDDNADYNIQQAIKNDILVGVYFFSTATSESEAKEEANWTMQAIKGYSISYPVVYDCEGFTKSSSRMHSLSASARTNNALTFLKTVKSGGYDAMLYGALSEIQNSSYWDISKIEANYKIWIAQYSSVTYPQKSKPDYNGTCHAWQYTNKGTVNGVPGNVDMVVCYFTKDKANPKDKSATPAKASAPLTDEEKLYKSVNEKVTAKDVTNLRKSATTKSDIVKALKNGEVVTRIGVGTNGWSKIKYDDKTVYAISSYLTTDLTAKASTKEDVVEGQTFTAKSDKVTAKDTVNLRTLPTTDSEVAGKLQNGDFLERTATSNKGWSRLKYNGQTVYAITSYLTTEKSTTTTTSNEDVVEGQTFTAKSDKVTAKDVVNLRSLPTTDSEVVGKLESGDFLERTATSNKGWSRLKYNGQTVYAITSYLSNEVVKSSSSSSSSSQSDGFTAVNEQVTAKSETNLRTKPSTQDSEVVHTLKNGEYVKRIGIHSNGWSKLEYNGRTVYAISSYLTK